MEDAPRTHNPLVSSAAGGRLLSTLQLPLFLLWPPTGYGVLTATGRKSGKRRRRCVRAVERNGLAYIVAIKGSRTGWLRNVQANPKVQLRIRSGTFDAIAREVEAAEREAAEATYCEMKSRFEYLEYAMWRKGRPTPTKVRELHRRWFEEGTPLVVELHDDRPR